MKYHLYFHNDFDGVASGAVMLNFLRSRGDDIASFNQVDYTLRINEGWVNYKFKVPFILVDFRYHPKASWWFDHHETSFDKPSLLKWGKDYRNDSTHSHITKYGSCSSLILAHLEKYWHHSPPKYIREVAKWADVIDAALYKSPREVIVPRVPALKLRIYLLYEDNTSLWASLIKKMAAGLMNQVVKQKHISSKVKLGIADAKKTIKKLTRFSTTSTKVVFVDATKITSDVSHYFAYLVYPKLKYSAILEKYKKKCYHLGIGFNRWQGDKNCTNIGKLMLKYGGGGHLAVGAVERKSKEEILKIAGKVIEYLNEHG